MRKIKVISCVITVAIMALIFFFSSQTAGESSAVSRGLTAGIAELLSKVTGLDSDTIIKVLHNIVRKMAHFTLFYALGTSAVITVYLLFGFNKLKLFFITLAFCTVYAATDEIHQIFVPGRGAMIRDVLIDSLGAAFGIAICIIFMKLILRRKQHDM